MSALNVFSLFQAGATVWVRVCKKFMFSPPNNNIEYLSPPPLIHISLLQHYHQTHLADANNSSQGFSYPRNNWGVASSFLVDKVGLPNRPCHWWSLN